jgi:hypothetical protein
MSLDFAILAVDGSPLEMVSLDMDQHDELIDFASELQLFRILRFHDYFEDVNTWPIELPGLQREIAAMRAVTKTDSMQRFLDDLHRLIELAIKRQQILYAVPD